MLPTADVAHLQLGEELGSGLGTVLTGVLMGKPIAAKKYRYDPQVLDLRVIAVFLYSVLCNPDEDRNALHTEALMLKRLEHPNVVKVFCLVAENGTTMGFGMEQLGESVANASDKGQLSARRLSRAFRATCEGVAHIHRMLVAHLDIKASNLCFARPWSCHVKLIDFDAAMALKQADDVLRRYPGTFAAASPELRARQHPCRALDEDAFMTGHTFSRLLEKAPADGTAEQLRARVMPLLRLAAQRPSVQQILENWNNPAPEPAAPLPTLLQSAPASDSVLTKLFQ